MTKFRVVVAACVLIVASLITGGAEAAPAPVSTCGLIWNTSVIVTQDLVCSGQDGIIVGANNITIDLNGHFVRGDGTHVGIQDSLAFDGVQVMNGIVRNFITGVKGAPGTDHMTVSNVSAVGNVTGNGVKIEGDFSTIKKSTLAGNSLDGAYLAGVGVAVTGTTASNNGANGLEIVGAKASVSGVTAAGNVGDGIIVGGTEARVKSSGVFANGGDGMNVGSGGAKIQGNVASANKTDGIVVSGEAVVVGQLPGQSSKLRNIANGNGYAPGPDFQGLGISATFGTTPPRGKNVALGNDAVAECNPANLC